MAEPVSELSPREKQVLDRLNEGKITKLIAYDLGLQPSTITTVVARVKAKAKLRGYRKVSVYMNDQGEIWRG